jgi:conjugal transfer pilus assembly protein TraV
MKKLMLPLAAVALASLTGCASVQYDCALKPQKEAKCASMEDTYVAANRYSGEPDTQRQNVFDRSQKAAPSGKTATSDRPFFKGEDSDFPEAGERGMPVFKQPEVHRVWVAPYVDSDGNLRTGEYTYFSTPGKWNYGTTKRPGEGSAIFGPSKPGANLGFVPVTQQQQKGADRPAAPPSSNASTPAKAATQPDRVDNITQPAQRIIQ